MLARFSCALSHVQQSVVCVLLFIPIGPAVFILVPSYLFKYIDMSYTFTHVTGKKLFLFCLAALFVSGAFAQTIHPENE